MSKNNLPQQYQYQKDLKVWMRQDYQGMGYSDGDDTESALKRIIDQSDDISVMSVELANHCTDWVNTYHLSSKRSNLLRPFEGELKDQSVLEIGSGCGAITRYMGESGANITALEGSPRRASITASRCRDLDNVTVLSDNFSQFETETQYDIVTLIGVLEYARNFVEGDDPVATMLEKAGNYLKPDGILIIAIENQLGLKYFAGYPEDHLGKPMYGIEEHYCSDTAVTFGRHELSSRIANSGLSSQQWWYPFPDYKMPSLFITESGVKPHNKLDLTTLVRSTCFSDRQCPSSVSFLQERAWKPVIKNNMLADMANSFVVLASQNRGFQTTDYYSIYYATERRAEYSKRVVFSEQNDAIDVRSEWLYPDAVKSQTAIEQNLELESYVDGKSWQDELLEIMSSPGWSVSQLVLWWEYWWDKFQEYAHDYGYSLSFDSEVEGNYLLDAMPRNLFCTGNDKFTFIDLEWNFHQKLSVRFLAFRSLLSSFLSLGICAKPESETLLSLDGLIKSVLLEKDIHLSEDEITRFVNLEASLQSMITGRQGLSWSDYTVAELRTYNTLETVSEKLDQLKEECRQGQEEIFQSTSWRVTKPIRQVSTLLSNTISSNNLLSSRVLAMKRWLVKQVLRSKSISNQALLITRNSGGFIGLSRKFISLLKREGFSGIKRVFLVMSGDRINYAEWVHRYDLMTDEKRSIITKRIDKLVNKPLISVVMPVYNPSSRLLIEAIESIKKQLYSNWELCIADDCSTDATIRPILEKYTNEDERIKIKYRQSNGHISAASNTALELVAGEWVALMDQDDIIPEHALFLVAEAINKNPDAELIYSDEDKIDERGKRHTPYFKSDWNPDLFFSNNMFSHLGVFKASLIREVGGFRIELEGSQDYDLVLRCINTVDVNNIIHIPHVLYHWRSHKGSTSQSGSVKPYTVTAGERALNDHFRQKSVDVAVETVRHGYRLKYALPDKLPFVSLIIPTYNKVELLKKCVDSIFEKTRYSNYEIIIVDNGSDEAATLDYLKSLSSKANIKIIQDNRPFNYSQLNNSAVREAKGEIIGLLNNDIEVISADWLSEMVSHALRPEIGAVGAKLYYPNNTIQHGGVILGLGGCAAHSHTEFNKTHSGYFGRLDLVSNFSAVTAACLVIKKSIYEEVGGLDEKNLRVAFNDVDFCLRVREAGYWNLWTPYAELYHHESASRGVEDTPEKIERFESEVLYMKEKWGKWIDADPAYSPNLTVGYEDFSYAWPPRVNLA